MASIFLQHNQNKHIAILDFGGGDGSIALSLADNLLIHGINDISITVVDYGKSLIRVDSAKITMNKIFDLEDVAGHFDFVIASAVLEHLPKPLPAFECLLSHLKENGIFYVRTPYIGPLVKAFGSVGVGVDFTYPAHLHDLGQDFWENYFARNHGAGYEILKSKPSIVQTTFTANLLKTLAAYIIKAPWYVLGNLYSLVGGWEVFVKKRP